MYKIVQKKSLNPTVTMMEISAVEIAVFISLIFSAPKSWEITTEKPIPVPTATMTNSMVMAVETPTAARASCPTSRRLPRPSAPAPCGTSS